MPLSNAQPNALLDGWRAFLARYPWTWFCTFTFAQEVHPEAADKRFRVWASKLSRSLYGSRWHKKRSGVYWIRALEHQRRANAGGPSCSGASMK